MLRILLTGKTGVGKSYFLERLAAHFFRTHKILHLRHSEQDVRQQIAQQLNLKCDPLDSAHLTATVHKELAAQLEPVILLCDDAEKYDDAGLEQIRQFNNLECSAKETLKIILCGNAILLNRLNNRKFDGLNQRLTAKLDLEPFDYATAANYITARSQMHFAVAQNPVTITDRDIKTIYERSNGLPQKLNTLVDALLAEPHLASVKQPTKIWRPFVFVILALLLASSITWYLLRPQTITLPVAAVVAQNIGSRPVNSSGLNLEYIDLTQDLKLKEQLQVGERWLLSQADEKYTIQRYLLLNPGTITEHDIAEAHLIELLIDQQKLYGVYQGVFPSFDLAQQTLQNSAPGQAVANISIKKIARVKMEHSAQ